MAAVVDLIQAVQAVQEAESRIPGELQNFTFFSEHDLWLFDALGDPAVRCELCDHHNGNVFPGRTIRFEWPYLQILDVNRIGGPAPGGGGLVHPNCKCRLHRMPSDWKPPVSSEKPLPADTPTFAPNMPLFKVDLLQFLIVKTVWSRLFNRLSRDEQRVAEYVRERNGTISISACALSLNLSEEQVKTILVKLRDKGVIEG